MRDFLHLHLKSYPETINMLLFHIPCLLINLISNGLCYYSSTEEDGKSPIYTMQEAGSLPVNNRQN